MVLRVQPGAFNTEVVTELPAGGSIDSILTKENATLLALIVGNLHDPKKVVPLRMVPLVLIGTVISHLSARRLDARALRCKWVARWQIN